MSGHTQGEWKAEDNGQTYLIRGHAGEILFSGQWHPLKNIRTSAKREPTELQTANARIAEAAPNLLAALESLVNTITAMADRESYNRMSKRLAEARAVIKKARGV